MNFKNTDAIFQRIANIINDMIPEEWDKVYLYGEILEDVQKGFFYYYPANSKKPAYYFYIPQMFDIDEDEFDRSYEQLLDSLSELWQEFKNNREEVWTNLTFILESSGKFKIDYDYTDLSEASDHKRAIIWRYNNLGVEPENANDKKFLEEYLKAQRK